MSPTGTNPAPGEVKKRAPTLYAIIAIKLLKGAFFVGLAIVLYNLSDNDLNYEYQHALHVLHRNPEGKFWSDLAVQVGQLTERKVLLTAVGTFIYSLFSLVEGTGLLFRIAWAGWMAIGESAFFIPLEILDLTHKFSWWVLAILGLNILIVWYLFQNRKRLFRHHHH